MKHVNLKYKNIQIRLYIYRDKRKNEEAKNSTTNNQIT